MAYARYKKLEKYIDGEPTGIYVEGNPTGETFSTKVECITGITDTSKWYWKKGTELDARTLTYFTIDGEDDQYIYGHNSSPLPFNSTGLNTAYTGVFTDGLVHAGDLISGVNTDYAFNSVLSGTQLRPSVDLLSADVSSWPSNCQSFEDVFYNCSNLIEVKGLNSLDVNSATTFWRMFYGCESLETPVDISSWNPRSGVFTNVGSMFYGCKNMPSITLPSNFKSYFSSSSSNLAECYHGDDLFYGCSSLVTLNLDGALIYSDNSTNRYKYMRQMFANCISLETLSIKDWQWYYYDNGHMKTNGMFSGCINLKTLHMESDYGHHMGYYMKNGSTVNQFTGCTNLTDIYIKDDSNGYNEMYIRQMLTGSGLSVDNINIHVTLVDSWIEP